MPSGITSGIISGPNSNLVSGPKYNGDVSRVGAGLARGANMAKRPLEAGWAQTWPAPGSTLDLDFINNKGFVKGYGQGGVMDALTYTRAWSGTWVDSTGLLRASNGTFSGTANALGKNLFPATLHQNFENWAVTNVTTVKNVAIAPDGTLTAYSLTPNTTLGVHALYGGGAYGTGTFTFSIYAKANGNSRFGFRVYDGAAYQIKVTFDLVSGTIALLEAGTATITDAGNGWWRITGTGTTVTGSMGSSPANWVMESLPAANTVQASFTGDNAAGSFIWGAQAEKGSSATAYYPTNFGIPRFDWASTTQTAQRNLCSYTELLNNTTGWTNTSETVTSVGSGKFKIVPASGSGQFYLTQVQNARPDTIQTFSVYLEASGANYFNACFNHSSQSNRTVSFNINLTTGATTTSATGGTIYSITSTSSGSGWKVVFTFALSAGTLASSIYLMPSTTLVAPGFVPTITGDGTSGVIVGYPQLELGSVATTYQAVSLGVPTNTPLAATSNVNGILIEEARTNFALWCRDATQNQNYLLYSQTFDNAAWNYDANAAFITRIPAANTAPDGSNTAYKISANTAGKAARTAYIAQANSSLSTTFTASIYMKAADYNYGIMSVGSYASGYWASFNLASGSVTTAPTASGTTAAISSANNGWYRCSITTTNAGSLKVNLATPSPDGTLDTGLTANSGIYIWGAQSENGTVIQTYQPTTSATSPISWVRSNVSVVLNQTGIDGVANAAPSITATSNNATCIQQITATSSSYTGSLYIKPLTVTGIIQITLDGSSWSSVDLTSNQWTRIAMSATIANPAIGVLIQNSGDSVAMDYTQIEAGVFPTTPIFTPSTASTRPVDSVTIPNNLMKNFFNWNAGAIYAKGSGLPINTSGNLVNIGDGTYYRGVSLTFALSNVVGIAQRSDSVSLPFPGASSATISYSLNSGVYNPFSVAASWGATRVSYSIYGSKPSVGSCVGYAPYNYGAYYFDISAGAGNTSGTNCKYFTRIVVWPKWIPDASLVALSSNTV